ncbi:MAG: metal-dependent hydrolase [Kiloniellaceae bacterium]
MDSLTQIALGAGVGAAVLGPRIGPRKAAIVGGLLGTLPDLDVLYPFDDPIDSFTLHRGASHAFLVHAVVTPIFGEALVRLFEKLRDQRWRSYLAVFLIFVTHAALDALTIYGTRIFWPLAPDPVGSGSIFIIDPLYTLPLLVVMVWALCVSAWTARFRRALTAALVISTAYLGWGLVVQQVVERRAERLLAEAGLRPEQLRATPTPFNTLFWKVIALAGDRYVNLYVPVFGGDAAATAYLHPRGLTHLACAGDIEGLEKLAAFNGGYFRADLEDDKVVISDLRMGLTPNYVFRFAVAAETAEGLVEIPPERRPNARSAEGDLDWLLANLAGEPALRPAEAPAYAELPAPAAVAHSLGTTPPTC